MSTMDAELILRFDRTMARAACRRAGGAPCWAGDVQLAAGERGQHFFRRFEAAFTCGVTASEYFIEDRRNILLEVAREITALRPAAREHLEEYHSARIQVTTLINILSVALFGGHVGDCSTELFCLLSADVSRLHQRRRGHAAYLAEAERSADQACRFIFSGDSADLFEISGLA